MNRRSPVKIKVKAKDLEGLKTPKLEIDPINVMDAKDIIKVEDVLNMINKHSIIASSFKGSTDNVVLEYANLCAATTLFWLLLKNRVIEKAKKDEYNEKCNLLLKRKEEIEKGHFASLKSKSSQSLKSKVVNDPLAGSGTKSNQQVYQEEHLVKQFEAQSQTISQMHSVQQRKFISPDGDR